MARCRTPAANPSGKRPAPRAPRPPGPAHRAAPGRRAGPPAHRTQPSPRSGPRPGTARPARARPSGGGRIPGPRWSCLHPPARTRPPPAGQFARSQPPAAHPARPAVLLARPGTPAAAPAGPAGWPPPAAGTPLAPQRPRRGRHLPTPAPAPTPPRVRLPLRRTRRGRARRRHVPVDHSRGGPPAGCGDVHIPTGGHRVIGRRHHPGRQLGRDLLHQGAQAAACGALTRLRNPFARFPDGPGSSVGRQALTRPVPEVRLRAARTGRGGDAAASPGFDRTEAPTAPVQPG
jgi:hypothetical protein